MLFFRIVKWNTLMFFLKMNQKDYLVQYLPWLFLVTLVFQIGCAPRNPQAPKSKPISLDNKVSLAIIDYKNDSKIEKLNKWPKNEQDISKLTNFFETINQDLIQKIGNFSSLNQIQMVHQSQNPEYRIQLEFHTASLVNGACQIPFSLKGYHRTQPQKDFEITFMHTGRLKFVDRNSTGYYFWGDILRDYQSSFPYPKILENLFILDPNLK